MKTFSISLITFFCSTFAFAGTYVCQLEKTNQTILLKKIQDLPLSQPSATVESKSRYLMQLQTTELPFPSVNVQGITTTADVMFRFRSDDGRFKVFMYMDDGTGTVHFNRKKYEFSNCRYF